MKKLIKMIVSLTMSLIIALFITGCDKNVTVTFDTVGGVISETTVTLKTNDNYTLPTPIKDGYEFVCWLNGETEIANSGIWKIETDVELIAKWNIVDYEVTFDLNGGSFSGEYENMETIIVNYGRDYDFSNFIPQKSTKAIFKGWKLEDDTKIESKGQWQYLKNLKLIAIWEEFNDGWGPAV